MVAANACRDATVEETDGMREGLAAAGWILKIIEVSTPGKIVAINRAEACASGRVLVYLDADVVCAPAMARLLLKTLVRPTAAMLAANSS